VAVVRALIVEPDPAKGAKLYATMFGPETVRDMNGAKGAARPSWSAIRASTS